MAWDIDIPYLNTHMSLFENYGNPIIVHKRLMFHLATFSHQAAFFENEIANFHSNPFHCLEASYVHIFSIIHISYENVIKCSCSKCHSISPFTWKPWLGVSIVMGIAGWVKYLWKILWEKLGWWLGVPPWRLGNLHDFSTATGLHRLRLPITDKADVWGHAVALLELYSGRVLV